MMSADKRSDKSRQDAENAMGGYERLADAGAKPKKPENEESCVRKMVMYGNLGFLLLAAAVVVVGYYLQRSAASSFTKQEFGLALIVLGVFTFIVSFVGCCGSMQRSRCLLKLFMVIMLLLIITQIAIGAFVVTEQDKVDSLITDKWDQTDASGRVDFEKSFSCCGLFSFNDSNAVQPCPNDSNLGCVEKLKSTLRSQYRLAGGVALAFALFEVFGLVFACILVRQLAPPTAEQLEAERLRQAREVNRQNFS